ncbi:DUF4145 domain-containing protein [Paracoccus methylovorus]|uniref:DUF4145 domain-containing protein n=1 Tax=Paracoccus methylovorus TaxID=2812658 RepID=A0ABX7JMC0_9RHOB|nr:DUF4145 domain-containing protein [Paracoccus methylovorus]QRZ15400.1 DUF4145 domain-containing protein [Paracoccus methylovorus]
MHYTCPYCQIRQIVQADQRYVETVHIHVEKNAEGQIGFTIEATTCANPDCAQTTLIGRLRNMRTDAIGRMSPTPGSLESWTLRPQGAARPIPDYIPQAIREDYTEACRIRDLSPKAAATLIRRCLQSMIRDFCNIKKHSLDQEIKALRGAVDAGTAPRGVSDESVDAIDRIRAIGNIGAHMEKDIDLIIPVEPDEAQLLIELTEMLFDEWYIAREKRGARLAALKEMADSKKELRTPQLPPDTGA